MLKTVKTYIAEKVVLSERKTFFYIDIYIYVSTIHRFTYYKKTPS